MGYNLGYPLPVGIRMARPRVYRHDVRCPECGSNWMTKDSTSKGRQVYHCGDCGPPHHPRCRLSQTQRR